MLRQEVGWFDVEGANHIVTRLASDTNLIQQGIGDKLGIGIQFAFTFVFGFAVGFYYGWLLTLIICAVVPFLAASGMFIMVMMANFTNQGQAAYGKAGAVASEVLSSIRTVASFGAEEREAQRYSAELQDSVKVNVKKGHVQGIGMGLTMLFMFLAYALAFYAGGWLISDPSSGYTGGTVLTTFFAVITGAFAIGQIGPR